MLLAIPTEIVIFIIIFLLLLFAIVAGVFYMAANKAQSNEVGGNPYDTKADSKKESAATEAKDAKAKSST